MVLMALLFGAGNGRCEENPFGICHPWDGLGELGVGWCRAGAGATAFDWRRMAPTRRALNFTGAERELESWLEPHGIRQVALLGYTPGWASSAPEEAQERHAFPPADLRDWSDYVERTARHFAGRVAYHEVWNEEDIGFWKGTCNDYCDLLKSGYLAVKRGNPDAKVVFGGLAGVNLPFLRECYEHGIRGYYDVMAVHPYQWGDTFNDEWFCRQIRDLRELMQEHGDDKEIFLTEFGWESRGTPESEDIQARLLMQAIVTGLVLREEARVEAVFPFTVRDWGGPGYGFIRHDDTRKPCWNAYAVLIRNLLGKRCVGKLSLPAPLRGYVFGTRGGGRPGESVAVLWSSGKHTSRAVLNVEADECSVMMMTGEARTERTEQGRLELDVGPQPVYIRGLSAGLINGSERVKALPPVRRSETRTAPVWMRLDIPETTRRAFIRSGKRNRLVVTFHNDSREPQSVAAEARVEFPSGGKLSVFRRKTELQPREERAVVVGTVRCPGDARGLASLEVTAQVGDVVIPPLEERLRICGDFAVEFLANSRIEESYLIDMRGCGGAPSVRFGGEYWTYRFDLTDSRAARMALDVGAHEAGYWCVKASGHGESWETILEGRSNRDWHEVDLTAYCGGAVFLRIEGDKEHRQQLGELVLTASSGSREP